MEFERKENMLGKGKISKQPSPYASVVWLFHGLRAVQVLSSVIVTCFLGFFIRHLEAESYYVPWTFILVCLESLSSSSPPLPRSQESGFWVLSCQERFD